MSTTPSDITLHKLLIHDERLPKDGSYPLVAEYLITRDEAIAFVRESLRFQSAGSAATAPRSVTFDCGRPVIWRGDFDDMDPADVEDPAALDEYEGLSSWDGALIVDRDGVHLKATEYGREVASVALIRAEDLIEQFRMSYDEVAPVAYRVHAQAVDSATVEETLCADEDVAKRIALHAANGLLQAVGLPPDDDPDHFDTTIGRVRQMIRESRRDPEAGGVWIDTVQVEAFPGRFALAFAAVAAGDQPHRRPKPS